MHENTSERVGTFKYLRKIAENGNLDAEIKHGVQAGWRNRKKESGVFCNRRIIARSRGGIYLTVVRPALLHISETWATKKTQEKELGVTEIRMHRWMRRAKKHDRVRNKRIRGNG
ncbi:uncharacterized protein LOC119585113 [Penaeus monodon]|uniref:uncharacterized protein LOC119585113 n=1 Tax=Penaeus monodon TaxID=6687 RepID=UPI0018A6DECF|nr:uncharacterized protein LOC119585113 [Penaeus monodon]